ncbi:hypothetical protein HY640_05190 [Candidatus Woesearchaeota archaeon]|nr:hypothetical protein [Candidatus Woesearchaeota archaeon]
MRRMTAFKMSGTELSQLFRAWVAVSLAFGILLNRGFSLNAGFLILMAVAAITVGVGFLLHELAHKVVALRYGCRAEFRSFDHMLILAVLMSFFGFVFAAPGAVFIEGRVTKARNGVISAVGPLTNCLLAIIFFVAILISASPLIDQMASYGLVVNSWLAVFNMIPILDLDGTKVLKWSKTAYFAILSFSVALMMIPYALK